MRVLIVGVAGMLGHKLWQSYGERYDTWGTLRSGYSTVAQYGLFNPERLITGVDVFDFDRVIEALAKIQPDVVINCVGIIKQLPTAKDPIISLTVNSLFPHRLANLCRAAGARLIHISTDCVFNGRRGMYKDDDVADAEDLYGRTKYLGEVGAPGCLTLRTSIIGRELNSVSGLVEWFLSNRGKAVRGFDRAIYSGFTTLAMARIIGDVIDEQPALEGMYQGSSEPIDKYQLLCLVKEAYQADIEITPDSSVQINRSLDSSRFRAATGFTPPSWPEMIAEMAADPTPYDAWK
jgi:dTDP-4-dehydrorhamnose reductase